MSHRGLKRFIEKDDGSRLPPAVVSKVRDIVTFLQFMETEGELDTVPTWKAHRMTGDRNGTWSLVVTANYRITFRIEGDEVVDLDYEDYH